MYFQLLEESMKIKSAKYVASYEKLEQCPKDGRPEFAFIGRSNVGKSSMINMITGMNALAKVSKSPGKTKLINFFNIDDTWYLVDLPGFGYAKVSKKQRKSFAHMIKSYISGRDTLFCTFMLIDASIKPQNIDLEFINWMGSVGVPFVIIFTKTDKGTQINRNANIQAFKDILSESWEDLPTCFETSSSKILGRDEMLNFIEDLIK
mgnify:CR=1 FL=1